MSVELEPVNPDLIKVPKGLATTELSLSEIGACIVWLSVDSIEEGKMGDRLNSPEMLAASKLLKDRGLLNFDLNGKSLSIKLKFETVGL